MITKFDIKTKWQDPFYLENNRCGNRGGERREKKKNKSSHALTNKIHYIIGMTSPGRFQSHQGWRCYDIEESHTCY